MKLKEVMTRKRLKSALKVQIAQKNFEKCSRRYEKRKIRKTGKVPFVLGKRFRISDTACWNKWERLFSNLRLLLGKRKVVRLKTSKNSDIAFYVGYYVKNSESIDENYWIYNGQNH